MKHDIRSVFPGEIHLKCVFLLSLFTCLLLFFYFIFFIKAPNLIWFPGQTHTHAMSCSHSETSGGVALSLILHTLFWVEEKSRTVSWDVTCAAYVVLKWMNETGWNNTDLVNHCPHLLSKKVKPDWMGHFRHQRVCRQASRFPWHHRTEVILGKTLWKREAAVVEDVK